MPIHTSAWGERLWSWTMRLITWLPGKETPAPAGTTPEVEAQQSAMATEFNWLHRLIFPRFFKKIQVDDRSFDEFEQLPKDASLVYITPLIGQLSFNYFNYLYLQRGIPLPQLANDLSLILWRPWGDIKRSARLYLERSDNRVLPLWQSLIEAGTPTLLRLKTSRFHDDLYWERDDDDPLIAVIRAAQANTRPVYCVPQDFIWDKHPDKPTNAVTLFLLGDRDNRGPLRKLFFFLLYYKRRAVARCGTPIHIQTWLAAQPTDATLQALTKSLRATLLDQLRIERTAITGPSIKPRQWLIEQVLHADAVQRVIYEMAADRGKPVASIEDLARRYADEIAADQHYSMIEIIARIMRWALSTLYDGITVDDAGIDTLKRAIANGPVVLVPNHRSHMDYMVLSTMLYSKNAVVPFIASGINLNFWPIGPIFRLCGSYFLRRSFSGNPLYKVVFQSYITELVRQGYCQEFFIEGTRSRTGKLAHPKLGMLSMLVDSWRDGASKDISFVPVSISYDQVMEVKSYAGELKGRSKATEGARDILRIGKFFRKRWGHVYLNFGEPISLGLTAAELWPDPSPHHLSDAQKPQLVQLMSRKIMYAINRELVVTPACILAMVLLSQKKPATFDDITRHARILLEYLSWKGAPCSPGLCTMPDMQLQDMLQRWVTDKLVQVEAAATLPLYHVIDSRRQLLDFTKNTGIHFFVSMSCLARLLAASAKTPFEEVLDQYQHLKQLFRYEFNFSTRRSIDKHLHTLIDYITGKDLPPFISLLDNYFAAYHFLFRFMQMPQRPQTAPEKQWIKLLMQHGTQLPVEAVSKSTFQNGLLLLQHIGVLEQTASGNLQWKGENALYNQFKALLSSLNT